MKNDLKKKVAAKNELKRKREKLGV